MRIQISSSGVRNPRVLKSSVFTAVEQRGREIELMDVLDRILDKGIVLPAWARFSQRGIDLLTPDDRLDT